jgi:hypothetical protein
MEASSYTNLSGVEHIHKNVLVIDEIDVAVIGKKPFR